MICFLQMMFALINVLVKWGHWIIYSLMTLLLLSYVVIQGAARQLALVLDNPLGQKSINLGQKVHHDDIIALVTLGCFLKTFLSNKQPTAAMDINKYCLATSIDITHSTTISFVYLMVFFCFGGGLFLWMPHSNGCWDLVRCNEWKPELLTRTSDEQRTDAHGWASTH